MRTKLTLFAAVCVAALALSTPASAATILTFGQTSPTADFVQLTEGSNPVTTLNTDGGPGTVISIPITITNLGGTPLPPTMSLGAFETFEPTTIAGGLASNAAIVGGVQVGFTGSIVISTGINGTGQNILTAVITNGRTIATGAAGGFDAANFSSNVGGAVTVTLTSNFPGMTSQIPAFLTGSLPGAVSLAFVNITPSQSGSGFTNFQGQNAGNFSTVSGVPEPASFISAGTAVLAGLGCFGWSRRRSSKA